MDPQLCEEPLPGSSTTHTLDFRHAADYAALAAKRAIAILAIKCCIRNMRWADFLDRNVRLVAPA